MHQINDQQKLLPLVSPLADYVAATTDPKKTLREVVALLLKHVGDIEGDARRQLND